jgi:CRISPR-associated protein Cas2
MYVLVTYDVATASPAGQRRLRHVAKTCLNFGQRVQNSVFECKVDPGQFVQLKHQLLSLIDEKVDSLRFYHLGQNWQNKVEHFGAKEPYNIEGFLGV